MSIVRKVVTDALSMLLRKSSLQERRLTNITVAILARRSLIDPNILSRPGTQKLYRMLYIFPRIADNAPSPEERVETLRSVPPDEDE